jgi:hypothetical protein
VAHTAERMKMKTRHIVPLSRQAMEISASCNRSHRIAFLDPVIEPLREQYRLRPALAFDEAVRSSSDVTPFFLLSSVAGRRWG